MQIDPTTPEGAAFIADHVPAYLRPFIGRPKPTHITCERCEESIPRAEIDWSRNAYLCIPCSDENPPEGPYLDPHKEWGTWR